VTGRRRRSGAAAATRLGFCGRRRCGAQARVRRKGAKWRWRRSLYRPRRLGVRAKGPGRKRRGGEVGIEPGSSSVRHTSRDDGGACMSATVS
jgi:hypothetical protein